MQNICHNCNGKVFTVDECEKVHIVFEKKNLLHVKNVLYQ